MAMQYYIPQTVFPVHVPAREYAGLVARIPKGSVSTSKEIDAFLAHRHGAECVEYDGLLPKFFDPTTWAVSVLPEEGMEPISFYRVLSERGYVQETRSYSKEMAVETVVKLSKGEISSKPVRVEFPLEGLDTSCLLNDATYQQIKDYVLEHTGLHVSTLYIAQVKANHGIIERDCYNKAKTEGNRVPKCPPEKEKAIEEALRHFQMIPCT